MPMSFMHGSSATAQQSQSTERFAMMFTNAALPSNRRTTEPAASAIASQKVSFGATCSQAVSCVSDTPAEWIRHLPAEDAQPMESCLSRRNRPSDVP